MAYALRTAIGSAYASMLLGKGNIMSDNVAVLDGYTEEVMLENIARDVFVLIKPGTDTSGVFKAWNSDRQEFQKFDGTQWRVRTDI